MDHICQICLLQCKYSGYPQYWINSIQNITFSPVALCPCLSRLWTKHPQIENNLKKKQDISGVHTKNRIASSFSENDRETPGLRFSKSETSSMDTWDRGIKSMKRQWGFHGHRMANGYQEKSVTHIFLYIKACKYRQRHYYSEETIEFRLA